MNRSVSSHLSISGLYGSSFDFVSTRAGGVGEQSSNCAYLRTVCRDTPTSLAIRRQETPRASRILIRCCMGVYTVMSFPTPGENHTQLGNLIRTGRGRRLLHAKGETPKRTELHRSTGQLPHARLAHSPLFTDTYEGPGPYVSGHWEERTCEEVIGLAGEYIHWYNHTRIKQSLGWKSPVEYRTSQRLAV